MKKYLDTLQHILDNGVETPNRTGTNTISVFGYQMRFDLADGFPAVTTKKLAWNAIVSELLWMISGSGDERKLREILHGHRDSEKTTIWTANAESVYWQDRAQFPGDLGRVYGVQWRQWKAADGRNVDQLKNLIDGIKKDPHGRRHIITAWNPGEIEQMALPPCHCFAQFYVANGKLSCQMYQRSVDAFLGLPFNIASYALFTHLLARVCNVEVGELIHTSGDLHLYVNHIEHAKAQMLRDPFPSPILWINSHVIDIDAFTMKDVVLHGYQSHAAIVAPMAV